MTDDLTPAEIAANSLGSWSDATAALRLKHVIENVSREWHDDIFDHRTLGNVIAARLIRDFPGILDLIRGKP